MTTGPYDDLSPADQARAEASDANLAGIVAGRLNVARALVAPAAPKVALVKAWAPYLHPERNGLSRLADTPPGYVPPQED